MSNQLNWTEVDRLIAERFISVQKHPTADLWIYNYTSKAQYENLWTPETKACRGLIVDAKRTVVARPFEKFFNIEQHESLPAEPFDVYEKMDGSLGVLYWDGPDPKIATRGSFTSPQAIEASKILLDNYHFVEFDRSLTYLFEILYPSNRIVVDYGDRRDLVLLAIIDTATGYELNDIEQTEVGQQMPVVRWWPGVDGADGLDYLRAKEEPNKEGFVIRYASGLRVKLKFADYKRLHKMLTGINERHLWEAMKTGTFDAMLERVPDEFFQWAKDVEYGILHQYAAIEAQAKSDFGYRKFQTRKESAEYFANCAHPSIMFKMLDGRDYSEQIWKLIEPKAIRTFKIETEG